jgi:ketosteroid isomerase-like protein
MRKLSLLLFLLLSTSIFSQDNPEKQISSLLDEWHAAAARADMTAYFDKIDDEGIYIGTDATEYWTKQAFYDWAKPYFDEGKAWSFIAIERHIYFSPDKALAWFDEKVQSSNTILRGSGVLRLKNGKWKIMQYVLSLPVPNEKFNAVIETISSE